MKNDKFEATKIGDVWREVDGFVLTNEYSVGARWRLMKYEDTKTRDKPGILSSSSERRCIHRSEYRFVDLDDTLRKLVDMGILEEVEP